MKWFVLFVAAALSLGGCARNPVPENPPQEKIQKVPRIGVSFPTTDLVYRASMLELLKEYEKQQDALEFVICDGENSQEKQNQDLMEMIEDSVDGIILIPYTMEGSLSVIQYANEKSIPVLTLDNRVETSSLARTIGYVGADHQMMGEQAARLLLQSLEERFPNQKKWNVIYLTGIPNSSGAVDRDEGIRKILSGDSRINLLGEYNGEFTKVKAASIMEDCLNVYPRIHGVICQNDFMAEGCCEALEKAGVQGEICIIGIDGQRSVVEKIAKGSIDGTVIQYPDMILEAVDRMEDWLDGSGRTYNSYVETHPITRDNAEEYLQQDLPW